MKIGSFDLSENILVVAEIGNNHEGSIETAKEMVERAAECGVGAVKFQTFRTQFFVSSQDRARYDRLSKFELSHRKFEDLQRLAKSLGLLFISTPLDLGSATFLEPLVDAFKIASGDNNFYPLLESVCKTAKPLIVSSGLSDLAQIQASVRFIKKQWKKRGIGQNLAVLHCVSSYPVPLEEANLAAIPLLSRHLGCTIGYSDHTVGIETALLAVAAGARVIEKHFTLDKNYSDFRDHRLSADPPEMKHLVQEITRISAIIGKPQKMVQKSEAQSVQMIRRSIVAAGDFVQGHQLRLKDLTWIRPGDGLPPGQEKKLIGRRLRRAVRFGEKILSQDVEER